MCRGLAAGWDTEQNTMICTGTSSHTETLGDREDHCIKLEIIQDDSSKHGYVIELDQNIPQQKSPYVTAAGDMAQRLAEITESWRKKNNTRILRWILTCRSYARISGDNDSRHTKIGGDNDSRSTEIGGDNNSRYTKIGGDNDSRGTKIGGDNDSRGTKIGKEWYIGGIKLLSYPGTTEVIAKAEAAAYALTMPKLVRWVAEHHEAALKLLGTE